MKDTEIPDHYLKLMDPRDRSALGRNGRLISERKAELDGKLEKSLHNLIIQYMNLKEIAYIHSNMAKRTRSTLGTPDFVFAIDGQACALECKSMTGELSDRQQQMIKRMRANGWAIEIVTTLSQAINFIGKFRK